jgi:hypothetical protein
MRVGGLVVFRRHGIHYGLHGDAPS